MTATAADCVETTHHALLLHHPVDLHTNFTYKFCVLQMYEKASLVGVYPSSAGSKAVALARDAVVATLDTKSMPLPEASLPGGVAA
jgi:hypothetical protein